MMVFTTCHGVVHVGGDGNHRSGDKCDHDNNGCNGTFGDNIDGYGDGYYTV